VRPWPPRPSPAVHTPSAGLAAGGHGTITAPPAAHGLPSWHADRAAGRSPYRPSVPGPRHRLAAAQERHPAGPGVPPGQLQAGRAAAGVGEAWEPGSGPSAPWAGGQRRACGGAAGPGRDAAPCPHGAGRCLPRPSRGRAIDHAQQPCPRRAAPTCGAAGLDRGPAGCAPRPQVRAEAAPQATRPYAAGWPFMLAAPPPTLPPLSAPRDRPPRPPPPPPLLQAAHYLVVDANVAIHQMDLLEHAAIDDVVVCSTVLEEVRGRGVMECVLVWKGGWGGWEDAKAAPASALSSYGAAPDFWQQGRQAAHVPAHSRAVRPLGAAAPVPGSASALSEGLARAAVAAGEEAEPGQLPAAAPAVRQRGQALLRLRQRAPQGDVHHGAAG
jgi:hypothetical protein